MVRKMSKNTLNIYISGKPIIPNNEIIDKKNLYMPEVIIINLGKMIITLIHEIFGHFMRRYYAHLTKGIICFEAKDDKYLKTGTDSGFFIEKYFLGFNPLFYSNLTISDALCLLNYNEFEDYPIEKDQQFIINREVLNNIIQQNKEFFDFIGTKSNQITLEDYLSFLTPVKSYLYHRVVGGKIAEDYISLKKTFF